MKEQSDELVKIRETQKKTIEQYMEKHDQARTEILALRKKNQTLEDRIRQQQEKMAGEVEQLKEGEAVREELVSQIDELEKIKKELHAKNSRLEKTIDTLTLELGGMKRRLEAKDTEIEKLLTSRSSEHESDGKSEVELYKSQIQQLMDDCKQVQEIKSQLQADNEDLNAQVEKLENALTNTQTESQRTKEMSMRLNIEKQDLVAMNNELQARLEGYQASGSPPESGLHNFRELESSAGQMQTEYCMVERDERQQAIVASTVPEDITGSGRREMTRSDSKQKAKTEHTVRDLLVQLQSEREKVDEYMHLLSQEQNQRQQLEVKFRDAQVKLQSNTSTHDSRVSQLKQEHQTAVNRLLKQIDELSAQVKTANEKQDHTSLENTGDDIQGLKSQVLSLVNELRDTEEKLKEAGEKVKNYRHKMTEAERQVLILTEEYDERCKKDSSLIDSLRIEMQSYDETLKAERHACAQERANVKELRAQHSRLATEYESLWKTHNEFMEKGGKGGADPRVIQDKDARIDNLTAQLVSADEAIAAKEDEIKELRNKLMTVQGELDTIPVLKAQADIFQADFQAEREAREKAHGDKEAMMQEMMQLRLENQQLQDELNTYTNNQLVEMQRRHGGAHPGGRAGFQQPGRGYMYPAGLYPDGEGIDRPGRDVRGGVVGIADGMGHQDDHRGGNILIARGEGAEANQGGSYEHQAAHNPEFVCPKCEQSYPDMDTLQIHILDCII
ncbi:optineurin-like isoform X2 [Ptychodera flava]